LASPCVLCCKGTVVLVAALVEGLTVYSLNSADP
jgi:hypothetical protein